MSIDGLVVGKLYQPAEQRTSKTGRPFVTCKVRAAVAEGESVFVNSIAFSESACAALLALDAGDSLALAGTVKPGAWVDREGNARPSLDIVAAQVLTVYGLKKKRESTQAGERLQSSAPRQHAPADDFGPAGDWTEGGNE
jgi:single-stranded DNA-binding protein